MLIDIYGEKVVNELLDSSNSKEIRLKCPKLINKFIESYSRSDKDGCQDCREQFCGYSLDWSKRKMDFPSWLDSLDFTTKHAKPMMIIGEDVSPKVHKDINIAYGLGRYEIKTNGEVDNKHEERNKLWICINELLDNKLSVVTNNVYVTDICKCNAHKKLKIWKNCSKKFLIKEICLINPKIIIFQGNTAYNYTRSVLEKISDLKVTDEDISSYFKNSSYPKYPKYGVISLHGEKIHFLKIYHTSIANQKYNKNKSLQEGYKEVIRKKMLPLVN